MKLGVFHHSKIGGAGIPDEDFAFQVLVAQMEALRQSGLSAAAHELHLGVNGTDSEALRVAAVAPANAYLHLHGPGAHSEIPTQQLIRQWLPDHSDWLVMYHHTKGVTHPTEDLYNRWRQRMEDACVWGWQQCVADLQSGYEAVGCHWLTPEKYPHLVTSPFFGGTFWWTTAKYLLQLPPLPEANWANRFEAESWIGRRRPYPRIRDYYPGWP